VVTRENAPGLVEVEVLDVARLVSSLNPAPTYIKVDIETNEVPVLRRLLSASSIESVHTIAVESIGEAEAIAPLLRDAGFAVGRRSHSANVVLGIRPMPALQA
jgi:hypothetical protein